MILCYQNVYNHFKIVEKISYATHATRFFLYLCILCSNKRTFSISCRFNWNSTKKNVEKKWKQSGIQCTWIVHNYSYNIDCCIPEMAVYRSFALNISKNAFGILDQDSILEHNNSYHIHTFRVEMLRIFHLVLYIVILFLLPTAPPCKLFLMYSCSFAHFFDL